MVEAAEAVGMVVRAKCSCEQTLTWGGTGKAGQTRLNTALLL